ncbi:hypothetical protein PPL_08121 [Heterostelium album PN500]|uniref:Uncharacterized protein n=1 Tax=Heterostelium pallidum (strain ATCC 26659 / Pp 5 / PN500) TaxID=670386 RepID=D3BIP0_HETP5|nr:hypothetical protein PPL_08121 [Heterostelium album PN500]EFA78664.1 hypothetical protein PPL_08121 [Heterostelium album PN500]|eukprot:XP_020430788.1 hypothetical protein PPL_08121 [Heterostelium album PN500]
MVVLDWRYGHLLVQTYQHKQLRVGTQLPTESSTTSTKTGTTVNLSPLSYMLT